MYIHTDTVVIIERFKKINHKKWHTKPHRLICNYYNNKIMCLGHTVLKEEIHYQADEIGLE